MPDCNHLTGSIVQQQLDEQQADRSTRADDCHRFPRLDRRFVPAMHHRDQGFQQGRLRIRDMSGDLERRPAHDRSGNDHVLCKRAEVVNQVRT